ncbi:amidohydrolase family protein [Cryobacterium tagatosivorans]|uniref:Hydrolase n=1 Tax=Cryobacterium tagatosivorans TaxID=1259199 RepID=A0A4R8UJR2_9MICO|nr:amidohydrolase family protein [Cryobacterium tagatosivorans]TFB55957.1 hydrolase [Cryobacterium tagatosivorans]
MSAGIRRIDAHLHLWDLDVSEYAWLGPESGELHASWTPGQAAAELDRAGMAGAVLVQAEDSRVDTQFLLDVAADHPWVLGVVGWIQLDDPVAAGLDLDRWLMQPAFRGVRHLINDDPREDFLDRGAVRASLRELANRGLPFDIHDAWPRHLGQAERLARDLPGLTLVIDHLAKPPRGRDGFEAWRTGLAGVAAHPNTVAKISGLGFAGTPITVAALRPAWDTALELFGPGRLMYGGDWPLTVPKGGYQRTWRVVSELVGELAPAEQASILSGTATRVYGLPEGPSPVPDHANDHTKGTACFSESTLS